MDIVFLEVDMGEGGPVSEFDRIVREAEDAIAKALAVPAEMVAGSPNYSHAAVYEAYFRRLGLRDWVRQ